MKRLTFLFLTLFTLSAALVAQPKYIFYFIGDGMGCNQVMATQMYLAELQGRIGVEKLCFTSFPFSGQLSNFSASNSITDSSAAGTCLASGTKTTNHFEGVDPQGEPAISIAETLHQQGWGVGITTSVSIDHATPAAFYAHTPKREDYYTIGTQLASSNYEFFGGSSFLQPDHKTDSSRINLYELCEQNGYRFAHGFDEYKQMQGEQKTILIRPNEGQDIHKKSIGMIPFAMGRASDDLTLPQIVSAAISHLSHNKQFFLMCEGGSIDWACHVHDGATIVQEIAEFDRAIQVAYNFYLQHPDETLIIVTADHETGGMALGNSDYTLNLQILQNQHVSIGTLNYQMRALHNQYGKKLKWQQVQNLLQKDLGLYDTVKLTDEEDAQLHNLFKQFMAGKQKTIKTLYSEIDLLSATALKLLNDKAHLGYTTRGHSASPVPLYAIGVGAENFSGWHDNSEIAPLLLQQIGL